MKKNDLHRSRVRILYKPEFFFSRLSFSINYVSILHFSLIEEPSREKKERKREKELVKTEGTFIAHL